MKKKTYEQPRVEVVKIEQTDIICTSTEGLTQDDFLWEDESGNFTEGLGEDDFGW